LSCKIEATTGSSYKTNGDAEKEKEEAAILCRPVEEFKTLIEELQQTSTVNDKDLDKLK
jgi:hypothetical protein